MKHVFYSLGITSFLVCMIFSVTTSITNPFYGMSEAAVAQATTYTQTSTGSENSSTDVAFVTVFNTQRFYVYDVATYTITESIIEDSYSVGGSLSGGYKGFIGASTSLSHNSGYKTGSTTETYKDATLCKDGGASECYKTPHGPTFFKW